MVNVKKNGETITFEGDDLTIHMPASSVIVHADKNSESVDIKLKASRKTILSFNYKDMTPTQSSAEDAAIYIGELV